jgi:hypothetical protein
MRPHSLPTGDIPRTLFNKPPHPEKISKDCIFHKLSTGTNIFSQLNYGEDLSLYHKMSEITVGLKITKERTPIIDRRS